MAKITVLFAAALIAVGLVGYFGIPAGESVSNDANPPKTTAPDNDTPGETASKQSAPEPNKTTDAKRAKRSFTALIPSIFGAVLLLCGLIAFSEPIRKHAIHLAATVALVGFLAGGWRFAKTLGNVFSDGADINWRTLMFVALMTVICATYVAVCFNSFMQARKLRKEEEAIQQRKTDG